jgi:hypothetical protein
VSADWTPATGDVKISKDGGAAANIATLPAAITMGNGAMWDFAISATELQAAQIIVTVVDSATKAVEDQSFVVETYGNASAQHAVDLSDSVRAGLTALGTLVADVWAAAARTLTAGTNIVLAKGTGVTGFNDLSAAQVNAEADTALSDAGIVADLVAIIARLDRSIVTVVADAGGTTTSIPTSSQSPDAVVTDQWKGRVILFDRDTATTTLRGQGAPIDGNTAGGTITLAPVDALTTAPVSGDTATIV